MESTPMMMCGHAANGRNSKTGEPACVICVGIDPGATIVADAPNLSGRIARCSYWGSEVNRRWNECRSCDPGKPCQCEAASSTSLAFFKHKPNEAFDRYYCGCMGWD